jgi:hypothetical protein
MAASEHAFDWKERRKREGESYLGERRIKKREREPTKIHRANTYRQDKVREKQREREVRKTELALLPAKTPSN